MTFDLQRSKSKNYVLNTFARSKMDEINTRFKTNFHALKNVHVYFTSKNVNVGYIFDVDLDPLAGGRRSPKTDGWIRQWCLW